MNIEKLIRPEFVAFNRYRVDNGSKGSIKLHKNENPWCGIELLEELQLNRYPDPDAKDLAAMIASHYAFSSDQVFLSRGSDEAIDLLIRLFCRAGEDGILIFSP